MNYDWNSFFGKMCSQNVAAKPTGCYQAPQKFNYKPCSNAHPNYYLGNCLSNFKQTCGCNKKPTIRTQDKFKKFWNPKPEPKCIDKKMSPCHKDINPKQMTIFSGTSHTSTFASQKSTSFSSSFSSFSSASYSSMKTSSNKFMPNKHI